MCAFCMRRFWSAEDLRRHMRTHSGERPYECDVCSRRFTLKHSMLRHKRKHGKGGADHVAADTDEEDEYMDDEEEGVEMDEEDIDCAEEEDESGNDEELLHGNNRRRRRSSSADAATANKVMRMQAFLKNSKLGSDLIGNLLGIPDTSLVEQLMSKPADDAARLLGVGASSKATTHRK